ncbi:MAG: response regulator [Anaerolineae bacterium]|nr:response regulator [Anaerolineae bacterium]
MAKRILVVDDDLRTLKLVGLILDQRGYDVVGTQSGADGLERARSEKPDLIILDVMMPDLDGFEVAQRLRSDPLTADVPILMLTARAQLEDRMIGFESGADDYVTKPVRRRKLVSRVESLLDLASRRRADSQ